MTSEGHTVVSIGGTSTPGPLSCRDDPVCGLRSLYATVHPWVGDR